ncbi:MULTISPECIES: MFS transporter [Cupriavidus]
MNNRKLFSSPAYRWLLFGRFTSSTIAWMDFTLIFSLLSYNFNASASAVGVASALYGLPALLLGPYIGTLADRNHPTSILLASYASRGATSIALIFCDSIAVFLALVLAKGIANLGSFPSEQILVRTMLPKGQLSENARVMTLIEQISKVMAPMLGAGFALIHAPSMGFALSAALSGLGMVVARQLQRHVPATRLDRSTLRGTQQIARTMRILGKNKRLRIAFLAAISQTVALGLYDPLMAVFLNRAGFPSETFGMIISATAIGSMLGAVIFGKLFTHSHFDLPAISLMLFGATVILPGAALLAGSNISGMTMLMLWVVNGCCYGLTAMHFGVILQQESPASLIGTISTTTRSLQLAALTAGPLLGAALSKLVSIASIFAGSGAIAMAAGATLLLAGNHTPKAPATTENQP